VIHVPSAKLGARVKVKITRVGEKTATAEIIR
jgi:predicted RNA-binding protein with TRAM domain